MIELDTSDKAEDLSNGSDLCQIARAMRLVHPYKPQEEAAPIRFGRSCHESMRTAQVKQKGIDHATGRRLQPQDVSMF